MTTQLSQTADGYVRSINDHDRGAFIDLFDDNAVVHDIDRKFSGRAAIKAWSDAEIFDVQVRLDVIAVAEHGGNTVLAARVDGTFDRTGLPDPLILEHDLTICGEKIIALRCRLAGKPT